MALKSKPLEDVRADVPVHEVSREDMVRVNFLVPASVRKEWKGAALREDKTLTELITDAMQARLAQMKQ
jgi:hypothetical protein